VLTDGGDLRSGEAAGDARATVDLYWLPLGAGGHFVRLNGHIYEALLWLGGHIPDVAEAVDSPRHLANDKDRARRVLDLIAQVPTPVGGSR
jgi:hypothetical protein